MIISCYFKARAANFSIQHSSYVYLHHICSVYTVLCRHIVYFFAWLFVSADGVAVFRAFLQTEFSEENLDFWLSCEDFKQIKSQSKLVSRARKIFSEHISIQACKEVNRHTLWSWLSEVRA